MKMEWETTFVTETGETLEFQDSNGPTGETITLGILVERALMATSEDKRLTGDEKYKRYEIMKVVKARGEIEDVEDVAMIKKCCEYSLTSPWLYGQVVDVLNQKEPALTAVEGGK